MRSWRPGYLPEHDDVEADAVGFDERAVLHAGRVAVVLGKPAGGGGDSSGEGEGRGQGGQQPDLPSGSCYSRSSPRPRRVGSGQGFTVPAERMTRPLPARGGWAAAGGPAC